MRKLGAKDFKINSIHFPKSVKELIIQEASENIQICTLLGADPQMPLASSSKSYSPRIPFKCKALVGGRYVALEGNFKIKEASEAGMVTEMNVVFPDGSCVSVLDKMKLESEGWETNLPSISANSTPVNIWMNTAGEELKMACMKFLLKTDLKSLKL